MRRRPPVGHAPDVARRGGVKHVAHQVVVDGRAPVGHLRGARQPLHARQAVAQHRGGRPGRVAGGRLLRRVPVGADHEHGPALRREGREVVQGRLREQVEPAAHVAPAHVHGTRVGGQGAGGGDGLGVGHARAGPVPHLHAARVHPVVGARRTDAAVVEPVEVHVAGGHYRRDRHQVRRMRDGRQLGGDAGRRHPGHPHLAVAPWLRGRPLDRIVAVFDAAAQAVEEALRLEQPARVLADQRHALRQVAPAKGQSVAHPPVRRADKHHGPGPVPGRQEDLRRQPRAVAHGHPRRPLGRAGRRVVRAPHLRGLVVHALDVGVRLGLAEGAVAVRVRLRELGQHLAQPPLRHGRGLHCCVHAGGNAERRQDGGGDGMHRVGPPLSGRQYCVRAWGWCQAGPCLRDCRRAAAGRAGTNRARLRDRPGGRGRCGPRGAARRTSRCRCGRAPARRPAAP